MATTENSFNGTGSQDSFSFTFPYLKDTDIKVSVGGVVKTVTTHYTLHTPTTIKFTSGNIPPSGTNNVRIYRETADTALQATFYPGSAIRSGDLNDNFTQNLYVTQESNNDSTLALNNSRESDGDGTYTSAISKANTAVTTANTASTNASNAVTTANTANATASTASTNATNAVNTANTASTNATTALNNSRESDGSGGYNKAIDIANTAKTTANSASSTATTASTNASNAVTTANTASTNATNAVTTANTASTNATNAVTTANTASTNASNAVTTANTASTNATAALNNSRESDGSGGYNSAISIANTASTNATNAVNTANTASTNASNAVTTANNASASVANSAIYQVVNNYAALPSLNSVDNGKFYQVNDSTGIESQSAVTGEPSGFAGDDELTVKLKSNTTASPKVWEWQEYYANDPETRYRKKLIVENKQTIDENYTLGSGNNAFSVGPVAIAAAKILTIPANSTYLVH